MESLQVFAENVMPHFLSRIAAAVGTCARH
jgi:hypothetical protein